jgi:NAD(P)-dependent dehydrogenase (short-subunit alcohol dehydrogenase family)
MAGNRMRDLKGKVAVVLGASAEGGTGWAVAQALAAQGAAVVVAARSLAPLNRLAELIGGSAVGCDAGSEEQVKALAQNAKTKYGKVDIAVNSAGLPIYGSIAATTENDLMSALRVNFLGVVFFIKYMAEVMSEGGSIINISSIASSHPNGDFFAYGCAKAAADCLVRNAAIEYGPRKIKVNSILPGPIDSAMAAGIFGSPGMRSIFERETPLKRIGLPSDFADAVSWLAGPSFVTGLNLQVSGGMQLMRQPQARELPGGDHAYDGAAVPIGDSGKQG